MRERGPVGAGDDSGGEDPLAAERARVLRKNAARIEAIRTRAAQALDDTREGMRSARAAVAAIGAGAQSYVREMELLLAPLADDDRGGSHESSARAAFDEIEQLVGTHVAATHAQSRAHEATAQATAAQCRTVIESVGRIDEVSFKAHLLGLNAALKASKAGDGGVLHILAQRMTRTNAEVAALNAGIGEAAQELSALLPRIAARAERLRAANARFETTMHEALGDTRGRLVRVQTELQGSVIEGTRVLDRTVAAATRAEAALVLTEPSLVALDRIEDATGALEILGAEIATQATFAPPPSPRGVAPLGPHLAFPLERSAVLPHPLTHLTHPEHPMADDQPQAPDPKPLFDTIVTECATELLRAEGVVLSTATAPTPLDYVAVIGFSGSSVRGALGVGLAESVLETARRRGLDPEDWLAELSNQLLGRMKNRLLVYGLEISLAIPMVLRGVRVEFVSPRSVVWAYPFESPEGGLCVWLDVRLDAGFKLRERPTSSFTVPNEGEMVLF